MTSQFDHLVIVAPTLGAGVAWAEDRLGVTVPPGGAHPAMGTHNHLMRLGPASFFEIIAIDPAAPLPRRARWFGMDDPAQEPRLTAWVAAVPGAGAARAASPIDPGPPVPVSRGALSWLLTVPLDGALIEGGTMPSLIQWLNPHPAIHMADLGCRLIALDLTHPALKQLEAALAAIGFIDPLVKIRGGNNGITATLQTPSGLVCI